MISSAVSRERPSSSGVGFDQCATAGKDRALLSLAEGYTRLSAAVTECRLMFARTADKPNSGCEASQQVMFDQMFDHMALLTNSLIDIPSAGSDGVLAKARVLRDWIDSSDTSLQGSLIKSLLDDIERVLGSNSS